MRLNDTFSPWLRLLLKSGNHEASDCRLFFLSVPKLQRLKLHTRGLRSSKAFDICLDHCWMLNWRSKMPIPRNFLFWPGTGGKPCFCQSHLGKFGAEALFYMFYNMPKENNQVPLGCVGWSAVAMLAFKGLLWMVSSPSAMGQICCITKLH